MSNSPAPPPPARIVQPQFSFRSMASNRSIQQVRRMGMRTTEGGMGWHGALNWQGMVNGMDEVSQAYLRSEERHKGLLAVV